MRRIKYLLSLGIWLCLTSGIQAQVPPADRFAAANAAYQNGRYEQAAERYLALIDEGFSSASLHYNLANTQYKLKRLGSSVLHYEKALRLDPSNEEIEHNLDLVRASITDNPEAVEDLAVLESGRRFFRIRSASFWAISSLVAIWLAFFAALWFLRSQKGNQRRITFFGGISLAVISVVLMWLSLNKRSIEKESSQAVVMVATVSMRDAPNGAQEVMILREGYKVQLLDELQEWIQVEITNTDGSENVGWVQESVLAKI
ncbi:MAG: tetratricopeptide repeat protein [Bacteroidota bacterium]